MLSIIHSNMAKQGSIEDSKDYEKFSYKIDAVLKSSLEYLDSDAPTNNKKEFLMDKMLVIFCGEVEPTL